MTPHRQWQPFLAGVASTPLWSPRSLLIRRAGTRGRRRSIDDVPELLESGRERAVTEGLDVQFLLGDAERLPADDASFDAVLSAFGAMFAPDHQQAADEIVRVTRPGGTVGLASWTPDGFIGEMFAVISAHVPPPAGVQSPMLWGTAEHLARLFGEAVAETRPVQRVYTFRYPSAEDFVAFFRSWYGPTVKAFEVLGADGRSSLAGALVDLAHRWDRRRGGSVALPAIYLETVLTLR